MTIKYYTSFVVQEATSHSCNEFNGVVEVDRPIPMSFDTDDIAEMLAHSFSVPQGDIRLLHWERVH